MSDTKFTNLSIEVNSLADVHTGKKVFASFREEIEKQGGIDKGILEGVGILEGGTDKGKTSIMLLCRINGENGKTELVAIETTAALFMAASLVVHQAIRKFDPPDTTNKD